MPASEAARALLVPLAGYELGHAVWRNRGIGSGAHADLQRRCVNLYTEHKTKFEKHFPDYDPNEMFYKEILPEAIALSVEYAVFQAEELFCDMFAYAIFGESYLYAFSYILAPGSGRLPGSKYPSYKTRISVLRNIAEAEGVMLPDMASLEFIDESPRGDLQERFIVNMAEESVEVVIDSLWDTVIKLISDGAVGRPNTNIANGHLQEFRLGIPAHKPSCLGDIINAGWMYYKEAQKTEAAGERLADEIDKLNEMILKTVEVLEYRRRTRK